MHDQLWIEPVWSVRCWQEKNSDGLSPDQNNSAPVVPEELQQERDDRESSEEPQEEISSKAWYVNIPHL